MSSKAVRELDEDCVIFEGAKLSWVLATELADPIVSLTLPLTAIAGCVEDGERWTLRRDPFMWPFGGSERKKSARSAVELLAGTVASRAFSLELTAFEGRLVSGF